MYIHKHRKFENMSEYAYLTINSINLVILKDLNFYLKLGKRQQPLGRVWNNVQDLQQDIYQQLKLYLAIKLSCKSKITRKISLLTHSVLVLKICYRNVKYQKHCTGIQPTNSYNNISNEKRVIYIAYNHFQKLACSTLDKYRE